MKRIFLAVMVVVLILIMDVPLGFTSEYKTASVVEVTGMVSVFKSGGEKSFTPKVGTLLEHGDRIITRKGASIALQIDSQYIKVGESTYMSLSELMSEAESGGDSTNIRLFTGEVWASISKPLGIDDLFKIETPTAVMGAKGTRFVVKYEASRNEQASTELVVLEGRVTMSTQAPVSGELGTEPVSQEIEMSANANESLLLDPALIQAISDEIEKRLKSGEIIDQINIKEIVETVAKAHQIEVKSLGLFVLEIIADEPGAYDPSLGEGLDQLIKQKKLFPPHEEVLPGPDSILYGPLSEFDQGDHSGIPMMPAPPAPLPISFRAPTWDFDNSPGAPILEFYATSAATIDADEDGLVDHLQITFNNPVDDSTFVPGKGIILQSNGALDPVDDSAMVTDLTGVYTDIADDAVVYFKLDHTASIILYNTGGEGVLTLPSGTLKNLEGLSNKVANNMTSLDHATPVLVDSELDLSLPYDEKFISLKFSEPLDESSVVDISTIKLLSLGVYGGGPIDLYGTTSVLGDQIIIRPLELGSVEDGIPSFISRLSKNLYFPNNPTGGAANIRLVSGFSISSDHGESYALPTNHSYPYDGPALSSIKRVNDTSVFLSVVQDELTHIISVTYTDYLESFNHLANAYVPATVSITTGDFTIVSQKIGSDHKTLELELSRLPVLGEEIAISQLRNITNSYGDDADTTPIYAQAVVLRFDGTEWKLVN
ncbi:FecR family protein [Fusibacter bizertensis]